MFSAFTVHMRCTNAAEVAVHASLYEAYGTELRCSLPATMRIMHKIGSRSSSKTNHGLARCLLLFGLAECSFQVVTVNCVVDILQMAGLMSFWLW